MNAGKVWVVTGACGGIGGALVQKLLSEKAVVWALDISQPGLNALKESASQAGSELRTLKTDIGDPTQVAAAVKDVYDRDKRLHAWVNNAGISGMGDFEALGSDGFARVMRVNFEGVVHCTRTVLTRLQAQGSGAIVNVGSVAGFVPAPYLSAYCASKHAVVGFTRALREELRMKQSNVRLSLVSPGFVDTAMIEKGAATLGFPPWLQWALSPPSVVADAILQTVRLGREESWPTWNGRVMHGLHTVFPRTTRRSADLFLARSFRDWVLNRYVVG